MQDAAVQAGLAASKDGPDLGDDGDGDKDAQQAPAPPPADGPEDQGRPAQDAVLGVVRVLPGETLSSMMRRIYGSSSAEGLERVVRANPQVVHPDNIIRGDSLRFPALPVAVQLRAGSHYWVRVAETDNLQSAVTLLHDYPPTAPSARLVPYSTDQDGFRFRVVLREPTRNRDQAQSLQALIPRDRGYESLVFDQWPQDAVFFANPYR